MDDKSAPLWRRKTHVPSVPISANLSVSADLDLGDGCASPALVTASARIMVVTREATHDALLPLRPREPSTGKVLSRVRCLARAPLYALPGGSVGDCEVLPRVWDAGG